MLFQSGLKFEVLFEVHSFLCFATNFSKLVPNFAAISQLHIDSEVSSFISECHLCQTTLDHHHSAPMMPIPLPDSPWLCGPFPTGETLLSQVGYYSRFPFVEIIHSATSPIIFSQLLKTFSVHGFPETITSDNGGQFTSYGPSRMGKLSKLIALLRKLCMLLLRKAVIGNMNWIRLCWATETLPIVRQVKRCLSFL